MDLPERRQALAELLDLLGTLDGSPGPGRVAALLRDGREREAVDAVRIAGDGVLAALRLPLERWITAEWE